MVKFDELKVGQTVVVRDWFGDAIRGVIEDVCEDVKNGRPGIVYLNSKKEGYWCYLNQIERIVA